MLVVNEFIRLYEKKKELKEEVEKELSEKEKKRALKDEHAWRKPIGCGFTIHPGYGCDNFCLYCYIQDLGFEFTKVNPNPLSGKELLYAVLNNPYVIPEITFLAFGSITDPFHPKLKGKTFEYMESLKVLGNPYQFSTKFPLNENEAEKLKEIDKNMSGLVTIATIKYKKLLEPRAPEVESRIETIKLLKSYIKPAIFFRPIIPGINDLEIEEITELALELKVPIVYGSFRATERNLKRLSAVFSIEEILKRLPTLPKGRRFVDAKTEDIIEKAIKIAKEKGVRYFIRASCHNAWAHKIVNPALEFLKKGCVLCDNNCPSRIPSVKEREVEEFLEYLGINARVESVERSQIIIKGKIPSWVKEWIERISRRFVYSK